MKIEQIETFVADRFFFVRLTTDDGTQGIGEGTFWSFPRAAESVVNSYSDMLLGQDPMRIEHIWNTLYRRYSFRGGAVGAAISAIDQALWDIKGKRYDAPVWDLLGGRVRDKVRAMCLLNAQGKDGLVESAARAVRDGFTAVKMTPFPIGWPEKRYPNLIRECTDIVAAIRETVGWDVDIGVEIHRNMVPSEAIVFAQQIEKFLPYFYEDPIAPDSVMSMRDVADKVNLPIAVGERNHTIWEFREFSEINGVAYVRPDVSLAGGISHVKKIAAIAESYHQRVIPHNFLGPVGTAVDVQLAACTQNWDLQEYFREDSAPRTTVVKQVSRLNNGYLEIPETPGIGMELNDQGIAGLPHSPSPGDSSTREDGSVALR
ncbi:MAG: mandelate racemase/muconate lactonizing enzyme family protein [SAR202 cluster bacterium]|jgi:galactonate dehydratase|nr:mandelate racemase/muconate lactonizing enzyme family protein [SAR202 cluster bacterium]MDP6713668.1 mandelate racemase/muconate lactonizing enzyme family protein [SAR202 cluster bacterium]